MSTATPDCCDRSGVRLNDTEIVHKSCINHGPRTDQVHLVCNAGARVNTSRGPKWCAPQYVPRMLSQLGAARPSSKYVPLYCSTLIAAELENLKAFATDPD